MDESQAPDLRGLADFAHATLPGGNPREVNEHRPDFGSRPPDGHGFGQLEHEGSSVASGEARSDSRSTGADRLNPEREPAKRDARKTHGCERLRAWIGDRDQAQDCANAEQDGTCA